MVLHEGLMSYDMLMSIVQEPMHERVNFVAAKKYDVGRVMSTGVEWGLRTHCLQAMEEVHVHNALIVANHAFASRDEGASTIRN